MTLSSGASYVPFGVGPFGSDSIQWSAEVRASIPSSRYLDGSGNVRFSDDYSGSLDGMNDSIQRAYVSLARVLKQKDKITNATASELRSDVERALSFLTGGSQPVLELQSVDVVDEGKDRLDVYVRMRDLLTGRVEVYRP